ncbi:type IV toxin-antitoxin system AbiEi family antitoxin [Pseudomonas prosekii]|uniref:Transcriptional regulator, AbiEi antitoxin, Type IV TA system n=1 Tax=Pseudomonas prosekii TaxID=1148509 RepID=A0A1H1SUV9_9PSED|nr:type IV toxin-antitoxin system AbiEi family antitoxin [Pseudomonas prosekii]SDS51817.1 Transcriptional regulator, AbiEi antitoxin, Type IV TA system [Pseudomonas prosekii]
MDVDNERLVAELLETLAGLPNVKLSENSPPGDPEAAPSIDLTIASDSVHLFIECRRTIFPRDVQQILWARHAAKAKEPVADKSTISLLAADSISPGARKLLEEAQVGYFAGGGSLCLPTPNAFFYVDRPASKSEKKSTRDFYSGRRAQVIHHLLNHPSQWFGVNQLATLAKVSAATVSAVLTTLDRHEWLETRGQGPSKERKLSAPGELLDAWSKQLSEFAAPAVRRYYVPGYKGEQLVEWVAKAFVDNCAEYAITHEAAAQRYAPFLTGISQVRCLLQPGWTADLSLQRLGARAVTEGANLIVIESKSDGDFLETRDIDSVTLASPVRVYLDLLKGEGRARELAEHLRKERIGF